MTKIFFFLCLLISSVSFSQEQNFSGKALEDVLLTPDGAEVDFNTVIESHLGKTVLLDFWASWCKDCILGFPDLQKLQAQHPEMDYVFLSLDKDLQRWKEGIEKYNLKGDHYFIQSGWKGPLCQSIDLDWIPRYILLNSDGSIRVYKTITTTDNQLLNQIK